jgi:ABC-type multidrug transport system fused ATPase/permease subunit
LLDGADIKSYTFEAIREKIGIVPQKAALFSGTIRENLSWGKSDATDEEIFAALEIAQAKNVVLDKGGLDALIEEGGTNLSGGQKQRLTIARALVGRPEVLILDDSASALDFATDKALRAAIRTIENTTVFIVSQRCSSVMTADKILVLDDGTLSAVGTHEELLKSSPLYKEIYESQFGKEVAI